MVCIWSNQSIKLHIIHLKEQEEVKKRSDQLHRWKVKEILITYIVEKNVSSDWDQNQDVINPLNDIVFHTIKSK